MNIAANPHCVSVPCRFLGYYCWLGIGSTTHEDLHGERMAPEQIDDFEKSVAKNYIRYQVNHDDSGQKLGVLVSAKTFDLPDGERALGVLVVEYTSAKISSELPVGAPNNQFELFQQAINIEFLVELDRQNMLLNTPPELTLEEKLESYFQSHIVMPDGRIRTNKHLVTKIGEFRVIIYPKDHQPAHFHLISKQRKIDATFSIESLEKLTVNQGKLSKGDEKLVKRFFKIHPTELTNLKQQAERLELEK